MISKHSAIHANQRGLFINNGKVCTMGKQDQWPLDHLNLSLYVYPHSEAFAICNTWGIATTTFIIVNEQRSLTAGNARWGAGALSLKTWKTHGHHFSKQMFSYIIDSTGNFLHWSIFASKEFLAEFGVQWTFYISAGVSHLAPTVLFSW